MDSPTGFDEDEFFGSYDAEKAHTGMSVTPLEFDEDTRSPTKEQLAHRGRFRRPVGLVVAGMALLSVVGLGIRGLREQTAEQPLVAHYGAALAATAPGAVANGIDERSNPGVSPTTPSETPNPTDASSPLLPEELSTFVDELWSVFVPKAPATASATVPLLVTGDSDPSQPPTPEPPLPQLPTRPDSNPTTAFSSAPPPMCLLPDARDRAMRGPSNR